MKNFRFNALIVMTLMALTVSAAPKKKSILSLKESITDEAIVYPYSFETNTQEMQKNWYLQNYAVVDANVENKSPQEVSDAEYIQRLRAIPSGIELPFNQVVKQYITRYITRERTMVSQILGMSPYYMPIFEQALEKEGLPHELKYIPIIESALDPNVVSSAGAAGLWQFMLVTSKGLGLEVNSLVDERRDPYRSSDAAAQYFKQLYGIYGDWSLAIAAYNCGPGVVNKALRRATSKDNPKPDYWSIYEYLPRETRGYVPAFIAATYVMNNYQKHNISPALAKKPLLIDTVMVKRRVHFNQISKVLNIPIEEIRILNPQYRCDIIPGDTHPYSLALPSQQIYSYIMVEDSIMGYRQDMYATRDVVEPGNRNSSVTQQMVDPKEQAKNVVQSVAAEEPAEQRPVAQNRSSVKATAAASSEGGESKYHRVKRDETIESIASDYGMSVAELMALNNLNRKHVSRGQVLKVAGERVPQAEQPKAQPTYAAAKPKAKATPAPAPAPAKKETKVAEQPKRGQSYSVNDEIDIRAPKKQKAEEAPVVASNSKKQKAAIEEEKTKASKKNSRRAEVEEEQPAKTSKKSRKAAAEEEEKTTSRKSRKATAAEEEKKSTKRSKKAEREEKKRKAKKEPAVPSSHSVKEGESLERIAHRYGLGTDQLKKANPQLKNVDMLHPGDNINIPKAAKKKKAAKEEPAQKKSKKKRK
ncbi:MAG: transglycosylase SLT domain-containing protein [Bacteroidales bacterium]|nr:transglycosylase SLT domain-containing protein [Bacteroidales bacterium]